MNGSGKRTDKMLEKILRKLFGDKNTKEVNLYLPVVKEINEILRGLAAI